MRELSTDFVNSFAACTYIDLGLRSPPHVYILKPYPSIVALQFACGLQVIIIFFQVRQAVFVILAYIDYTV